VEHIVHLPEHIDVRAVHAKLGMSQHSFAAKFGVSISTVRNWEQGRRRPEGPARVLLTIIDREPEAVERALAGQRLDRAALHLLRHHEGRAVLPG
jgi:putative transcriptional regulator